MNTLKNNLEQREKSELIAIIRHMLRQEPELQWLSMTPLEYVAFSVILMSCIDGLDSCFAGEENNPEMRLRVPRTLFAIFRFYTDSGMDLDEDIAGLLVGNASPEERQVIAGWVQDALKQKATWSSGERYEFLLAALEQANSL